jgi:hypothetical protein
LDTREELYFHYPDFPIAIDLAGLEHLDKVELGTHERALWKSGFDVQAGSEVPNFLKIFLASMTDPCLMLSPAETTSDEAESYESESSEAESS